MVIVWWFCSSKAQSRTLSHEQYSWSNTGCLLKDKPMNQWWGRPSWAPWCIRRAGGAKQNPALLPTVKVDLATPAWNQSLTVSLRSCTRGNEYVTKKMTPKRGRRSESSRIMKREEIKSIKGWPAGVFQFGLGLSRKMVSALFSSASQPATALSSRRMCRISGARISAAS